MNVMVLVQTEHVTEAVLHSIYNGPNSILGLLSWLTTPHRLVSLFETPPTAILFDTPGHVIVSGVQRCADSSHEYTLLTVSGTLPLAAV